jgi:hypothetical protein
MGTKRGRILMRWAVVLFLGGLALVSLVVARAHSGAPGYDLSWWTVDGGGGASRQGDYTLIGTAGQAEVGRSMGGGAYELAGGFWGVGGETTDNLYVYLPIVLR